MISMKKEILEESIGESFNYKVISPNVVENITENTVYLILKSDEIIEHIYFHYLLNIENNKIQESICNLFNLDSLVLVSIMGKQLFIKHIQELFKTYGIEAIQRSFLVNGSHDKLLFAKNSWYYRGHQIFQLN